MINGGKVVIDTNVLVSALWSENGNSAEIMKMIPNDIIPYFSKSVFEEYTEVLNRPKFTFSANKKERLNFAAVSSNFDIINGQPPSYPYTHLQPA